MGDIITIFGDDFLPDTALVLIGGAPTPVIAGNVASLQVKIPGGAIAGTISVTQDGLTATSSIYFKPLPATVGTFTNLFAQREISQKIGFLPLGAVADLDGDSKSDLVTATQNSLEIFQNRTSTGLFTSNSFRSIALPLTQTPSDLALADLDGDDKPDLVFIEGETLKIRQNLIADSEISSNDFAPPLLLSRRNIFSPLRVADVDHDGRPDIVVRNAGRGIQVFWNRSGNGILSTNSFTNTFLIVSETGLKTQNAENFEVADLNQDGHPDIAAVLGTNLVVFALQDQTGFLRTNFIHSFVLGPALPSFSIADLNNDGIPDLLATAPGAVVGYINHSLPEEFNPNSFEKVVLITSGYPFIRAGDFDGDGRTDLLADNRYLFKIVFEGGRFIPQNSRNGLFIRPDAYIFAVGDFNGDNRPDLVGLTSALVILQNLGEGSSTRMELRFTSSRPTLNITGAPMSLFHLQTSDDLVHWRTLTDLRLNVGGESSFGDATRRGHGFYRLTQ